MREIAKSSLGESLDRYQKKIRCMAKEGGRDPIKKGVDP
jgi:hypothetical protein